MPTKTEPKIKPLKVDARSARVVLAYVGENERSARNAPPRDLTENDVARLTFVEQLREVANDVGQPIDRDDPDSELYVRPDPRDPDPQLAGEIVAELVASGHFSTDVPEQPAEPAPSSPTPEPDQPAAEPEG